MNGKKDKLDVELVGSQDRPNTAEDRKAFAKFFKNRKTKRSMKKKNEC